MRPLAVLLVLAALLAGGAWLLARKPGIAPISAEPVAARDSAPAADTSLEVDAHASVGRDALAPTLPLANSDRIRGRVVRGRQAIPVAGVEVRCSKIVTQTSKVRPVHIDIGARFQTEEPGSRCTSGPDGSFEMKDLDRGALYTLRASGLGWTMLEPLVAIAPSEDERLLAVGRIYVARVLATDEIDVPIERGVQYLRYARVAGPGECKSLPFDPSPPRPAPEVSAPGAVYEFASDCDAPSLGPFRILICCAGFERQDFEFWAYPQGFRSDVTTFRLKRSQDKAGTLRVRQVCGCAGASCEHLLEGTLELEGVDGAQEPQSFDLAGLVREQAFAQLPAGQWRARVRAKYGAFRHPDADLPALEIAIGDEPALLEIPVANLGAIRFLGERDQRGLRQIPLSWTRPGGSEGSDWLSTSLVMRGVGSGTHTFESKAASCGSVEGARSTVNGDKIYIAVDVVAGETQTVTIR